MKIERGSAASFHVEENVLRSFDAPWHFHPECELTLIVESRGKRFVGDSIEPFHQGDLVLLGPDLPHFWVNDPDTTRAHAVVVQFLPDFAGPEFLNLPEMREVARLMERAGRGLHFRGRTAAEAGELIRRLPELQGLERFMQLLNLLRMLACARGGRALSGANFNPVLDRRAGERINRACRFVIGHYHEDIGLEDVASVACMSPSAFSRYFKQVTGRNVTAFLTQTRVDAAARLLLETEHPVTEICYATGFNNLSNFNRRFRASKGVTPRELRRQSGFPSAVNGRR
jgi:AraC-like DNA-binding protein